jgi:hypothetical protein
MECYERVFKSYPSNTREFITKDQHSNTGTTAGACVPCTNALLGQYYTGDGDLANACPTSTCQTDCSNGQYRDSCEGTSSGSCVACPTCGQNEFNSGCSGLNEGTCTNCLTTTVCSNGQYLSGCTGQSSGSCISCSTVSGKYFTSNGGTTDSCSTASCASCPAGQYRPDCEGTASEGTCTDCDSSACGDGTYLSGCSLVNPGTCTWCSSAKRENLSFSFVLH